MMKKWISRMLLLALCLCMAAPVALAADVTVLPTALDEDIYRTIRQVATVDGKVYLLTSSRDDYQLWRWTKDMETAELIAESLVRADVYESMDALKSVMEELGEEDQHDLAHALSVIFSDGEKLYGFNHLNSLVFTIQETASGLSYEDVITLPETRALFDAGAYSAYGNGYYEPIDVIKTGDWMLWHRFERNNRGSGEVIIAFNLLTGAVKQAVLPGLKSMEPYKEGKALVLCEGTDQALYAYDPAKDMSEYLGLLPKGVHVRDIAYSESLDMILYQDRTRIMGWTKDGSEQLGYIPTVSYANVRSVEDLLLYTVDDQLMTASTLQKGYSTEHSLTMMGGTMYTVLGQFAMSYQDVPVYYMDLPSETTHQQLLSRVNNFPDLVYMMGNDGTFRELMESGLLMDLSGYEEIKAYVDALYPAYRQFVTRDGGIYGVPVMANSYTGWFINKEVMEDMGLTAEEIPTSLTELCTFATRWNNEFAAKYPHYTLLNNTSSYRTRLLEAMLENWSYYCQYHGKALTFDDPIFREMLAALDAAELKNLDDALKQTNPEVSEYKQALIWTGCKVVGNWGSYMEEYSDRIFIPLTLTPDTEYISAVQNIGLWMVSANSENGEYAAAILGEAIEMLDEKTAYVLRQDRTEPVLSEHYADLLTYEQERLASLEARLDDSVNRSTIEKRIREQKEYMEGEMMRLMYVITPSSIANYREKIMPVSFVYQPDMLTVHERNEEVYGCIKRYAGGTMTAEKFIEQMNALFQEE